MFQRNLHELVHEVSSTFFALYAAFFFTLQLFTQHTEAKLILV